MLHAPTRRKCDIDNYTKALFDALESAGVIENDNQFDQMAISRGEIIKGGRAVVNIYEIKKKVESTEGEQQ